MNLNSTLEPLGYSYVRPKEEENITESQSEMRKSKIIYNSTKANGKFQQIASNTSIGINSEKNEDKIKKLTDLIFLYCEISQNSWSLEIYFFFQFHKSAEKQVKIIDSKLNFVELENLLHEVEENNNMCLNKNKNIIQFGLKSAKIPKCFEIKILSWEYLKKRNNNSIHVQDIEFEFYIYNLQSTQLNLLSFNKYSANFNNFKSIKEHQFDEQAIILDEDILLYQDSDNEFNIRFCNLNKAKLSSENIPMRGIWIEMSILDHGKLKSLCFSQTAFIY